MSNNKKRKQPPLNDSDEENKSSNSNRGYKAKRIRKNPNESNNEKSDDSIKSSLPFIDLSDSQKDSDLVPNI